MGDPFRDNKESLYAKIEELEVRIKKMQKPSPFSKAIKLCSSYINRNLFLIISLLTLISFVSFAILTKYINNQNNQQKQQKLYKTIKQEIVELCKKRLPKARNHRAVIIKSNNKEEASYRCEYYEKEPYSNLPHIKWGKSVLYFAHFELKSVNRKK